jgi:hypothetical protein
MILLRQVLAFPLYAIAFVCHLLTSFFTWAAMAVAGDNYGHRFTREFGSVSAWALVTTMLLLFTALPILAHLYRQQEMDPSRLEVVSPMTFDKADFSPSIRASLIPGIRAASCVFSEKAIRHYVRPAQASFPSCGGRDVQVTIDDNLVDITVSGMATIEKTERPFTVVLQHYPTSMTMDGLIVTAIKVDADD